MSENTGKVITPVPELPAAPSGVPQVVDDRGYPIVGPELDAVLKRVTEMAMLANTARMRVAIEREQVKGVVVERTLDITDTVQYMDIYENGAGAPWATVSFYSDGPDDAFLSINGPYHPITIKKGEVHPIDLTRSEKRLQIVYYWCAQGKHASVRANGKY